MSVLATMALAPPADTPVEPNATFALFLIPIVHRSVIIAILSRAQRAAQACAFFLPFNVIRYGRTGDHGLFGTLIVDHVYAAAWMAEVCIN